MVFDLAGDEHDALAQQARINVKATLAAVRLLDDDRDEATNNVGVVGHGSIKSFCPAATNIGAGTEGFKPMKR